MPVSPLCFGAFWSVLCRTAFPSGHFLMGSCVISLDTRQPVGRFDFTAVDLWIVCVLMLRFEVFIKCLWTFCIEYRYLNSVRLLKLLSYANPASARLFLLSYFVRRMVLLFSFHLQYELQLFSWYCLLACVRAHAYTIHTHEMTHTHHMKWHYTHHTHMKWCYTHTHTQELTLHSHFITQSQSTIM